MHKTGIEIAADENFIMEICGIKVNIMREKNERNVVTNDAGANIDQTGGDQRCNSQALGKNFNVSVHFSEQFRDLDTKVISILRDRYIMNYFEDREGIL